MYKRVQEFQSGVCQHFTLSITKGGQIYNSCTRHNVARSESNRRQQSVRTTHGCTRPGSVALLAGPLAHFISTCLGSVALYRGRVCGHCCLAIVSASTREFHGMGKLRPHQTTGFNNHIGGLFPRFSHNSVSHTSSSLAY